MMKEVMETFVRGNSAIVQRIEHSPIFKMWFKSCQPHAATRVNASVANLRAAKHRFESFIKPLARFVLYVEAITATALRIVAERGNEVAAQDAKSFLTFMNTERLLQAAMMADAADETAQLIRTCDAEDWDTAKMMGMLENYKSRVKFLFDDRGVLQSQSFTQHMLKYLRRVHTWVVDNRQCSIGSPLGVPHHVLERCIARMQHWRALALTILSVEFPEFEVYGAFSIFDLPDDPSKVAPQIGGMDEYFRRLAQAFNVGLPDLKSQYEDHLHLALRIKMTQRMPNGEAWRMAIQHTQAKKAVRADHPAGALAAVVKRYRAFGISTSGVERAFSKQMWLFGTNGDHQADVNTYMKFKLVNDYNEQEADEVMSRAQQIWSTTWSITWVL